MQYVSRKESRLRNVEIELHTLCFGVLQVHVLGEIHAYDPSHGLAVLDDEGACEQERRSVTTYYMNLDMECVLLPEEFLRFMQGQFC